MNKKITYVFNLKDRPGTIIKFQWKNNIMKSLVNIEGKVKTEKNIDEKTFKALMKEIENDEDIVGPHSPGSLVQSCCPKIKW